MTALNIVPECYVDARVAQMVGKISKLNHQHGHGNVANKMKFDLKNKMALGIIDQDTIKVRKSDYFDEFETIREQHNLIISKHNSLKHYLVVICPEIKKWLMYNADSINVSPDSYGLPKQLSGFVRICKRSNIDKNQSFTEFVKELIRKEASGIITLKAYIKTFLAGEDL